MSERSDAVVIVGANLTGGAAASTLREEGFDGTVVLIGAEPHVPYERPPLSKEYLRGETSAERTRLRPEGWYAENAVDLVLGVRVSRIDAERGVVQLEGGDGVPYGRLLVATGGTNRRLAVPGNDLDGVLGLRTIEDADAIRRHAVPGRRAVVVGAGFIGCEVAASLRALGVDVEVVEFFPTPLYRVVGPDLGAIYEEIHRDHGVRFHFGEAVERFEGSAGRVAAVATDRGTRIECDFAVVGVGIQPAVDVVAGTGVEVENGILVDEFCSTNVPGIFAAGDVANHHHPIFERRMRVEHWDNALKQGAAAARNMMGTSTVFDDPHWFWSDQYDHNLQYVGYAPEWDAVVTRGSVPNRSFVMFYLKDGLVRAAAGIDRGRDVRRAATLIRARRPVDPALLEDENVDLRKIVRPERGVQPGQGE